jgi:hypothetical protein
VKRNIERKKILKEKIASYKIKNINYSSPQSHTTNNVQYQQEEENYNFSSGNSSNPEIKNNYKSYIRRAKLKFGTKKLEENQSVGVCKIIYRFK